MGLHYISIQGPRGQLAGSRVARFMLAVTLSLTAGCSSHQQSSEPTPISVSASPAASFPALAQATATPQTSATPVAPGAEEITKTIARIFEKSATVDQGRSPAFLVGDFNGDGSEDLAVMTKPNDAALSEINNELANWTLEDPHEVPIPGTKAADQLTRPKAVKAESNDELLAIIHGVGQSGWRNPQARQAFLLRNSVGTDATVQTAASLREVPSRGSVPLRGDAIMETVKGHRGLIFWTGARYGWAPQR